jgi:hypothetical protein
MMLVTACTESTPTDPDTTAAASMGNHCAAPIPGARAWNGVATPAPYGKITLVLRVDPQNAYNVQAFFIDRAADKVYDRVNVNRQALGGMISSVVALNQDLAIVGNATGPIPGGGGGPRPGQEGIYALDLAGGLGWLASDAEYYADACPK